MKFRTKSDIISAMRNQITSNPNSAIRAMLRIYQYQTIDEQNSERTVHSNGVGFMSRDAELLSSFCKQYNHYHRLSERQISVLLKVIGKYAGQLVRQAIDRGLYTKQDGMWVPVAA